MERMRLALIGFGNVGQSFVQILSGQGEALAQQFGVTFTLVAVCDPIKGSVSHPEGLLPAVLLEAIQQNGNLDSVAAPIRGWDALQTIEKSNADVVIEVSPPNLETGEPATTYLQSALKYGKHIVTTNKGPIALYYHELHMLAQANQLQIGIEGTVMSGTPVLHLARQLLETDEIQRIQGIVNGATNYILTRMEQGMAYTDALREAQKLGYAETDPTSDVEGDDAAAKMVILANLLMGEPYTLADVTRTGITQVTSQDIDFARMKGLVWKLVGTLEKREGRASISVCPTLLPLSHPLARICGITNALTFTTQLRGEVTMIGPGAGCRETGSAIISDLLAIHQKRLSVPSFRLQDQSVTVSRQRG
jgi:homoserine dehydrogenase